MKSLIILALYSIINIYSVTSQEIITFEAPDGLTITANLYEIDESYPYILLFHQARSSKGEYKDIAIKLLKLGYNCLAVDLRSGDNSNFIQNETASQAVKLGLSTDYLDAEQDIKTAVEWAYKRSGKPIIIFGSSYSASLCLKISKNDPRIKGVVAFSPGEHFKPNISMCDELKGYLKPTFVASTQKETKYISDMFLYVPTETRTIFSPQNCEGEHGAKALWKTSDCNQEYWLALLLFFKEFDTDK
ncbi:MAG: dienelactone hydrolase family protein [Bacteroidota bacterium]